MTIKALIRKIAGSSSVESEKALNVLLNGPTPPKQIVLKLIRTIPEASVSGCRNIKKALERLSQSTDWPVGRLLQVIASIRSEKREVLFGVIVTLKEKGRFPGAIRRLFEMVSFAESRSEAKAAYRAVMAVLPAEKRGCDFRELARAFRQRSFDPAWIAAELRKHGQECLESFCANRQAPDWVGRVLANFPWEERLIPIVQQTLISVWFSELTVDTRKRILWTLSIACSEATLPPSLRVLILDGLRRRVPELGCVGLIEPTDEVRRLVCEIVLEMDLSQMSFYREKINTILSDVSESIVSDYAKRLRPRLQGDDPKGRLVSCYALSFFGRKGIESEKELYLRVVDEIVREGIGYSKSEAARILSLLAEEELLNLWNRHRDRFLDQLRSSTSLNLVTGELIARLGEKVEYAVDRLCESVEGQLDAKERRCEFDSCYRLDVISRSRAQVERSLRLFDRLLDPNSWKWQRAELFVLWQIGQLGILGAPLFERVLYYISHSDYVLREAAFEVLAIISPNEQGARAVFRGVTDRVKCVRMASHRALEELGSLAACIEPELNELIKEKSGPNRSRLKKTLVAIRGE